MPGMQGAGGMWSMTGPMWMPDRAPSLSRLVAFHLQPVPIVPLLGLVGLIGYLLGVAVVTGSGGRWPLGRTLSWLAGIVLLEAVTTTGIEAYGMMLFSVHMAQHMVLAMVVPILLALGSPYRLALAAAPEGPGGAAVRRLLPAAAGSRAAGVLLSLPVRWCLFLASLYGIYFTPLFQDLMHTVWGHNVMLLHFLLTGCLFFGPLVSEPRALPHVRPAPRRLAETFASTPLHAVFGLIIMFSTGPVLRFFDDPDPSWAVDPLSDQTLAGSIAWATSEAATVLVMVILLARWARTTRAGGPARSSAQARIT
ncbi:cytochrome c oxidase assembly protein [Nocardioides sp. BP30]|uniref:cytochrome c oxidase assembly protein n=1 Tax=Nocardioides sp. BP30 TaxID=3036374 RepID=UPI00246881BF|nr:cytochrome c oxidase assembly protein [Nocardioides sp. BP30]WGL54220.1 cytochrome c oxidase assembly protein [Nocardioides sp. BP30]